METKPSTADVVDFEVPGPDADSIDLCDEIFIKDLKRLKELRSFLIEQAVCMDALSSQTTAFGNLNRLRYRQKGRMPTEAEWTAVENNTEALFKLLTEPLRRKFILGETPWWVTYAAAALAAFAVGSLVVVVTMIIPGTKLDPILETGSKVFPYYIGWLLSVGAIGSIAFIAMNALSLQEDATFDLTNTRLMVLRIALGGLFALMLCIPFGFHEFLEFVYYLKRGGVPPPEPSNISNPIKDAAQSTIMLLLPFILGFSTSLVIMILNRFVEAVQTFFGKGSAAVSSVPTSGRPS
jgi:hypothetical protein